MRWHRTVQAALAVLASATSGLLLVGRSLRRRDGGGFVVPQIALARFG